MIWAIILALICIVGLFELTNGNEPLLAFIVLLFAIPALIATVALLILF